ncbi:MAG TPA: hypothetical protein VNJ01_06965 [Bacteriovoracaceae bacterium]|nr:hypothetical protein [Bacteriovoracaceae bacterium]
MNLSQPMLICDQNEEFRFLLRDMLTKNGYFHVLEATTSAEAAALILGDKKDTFVLIDAQILAGDVLLALSTKKHFIVFNHGQDEATPLLAARLGVRHLMSYPFSSAKLVTKINSLV